MNEKNSAAQELVARRKRYDKQCLHCGADYTGLAWSKYCSDHCRHTAKNHRRSQQTRSKK